jgi:Flp pilus assembly protein TadD
MHGKSRYAIILLFPLLLIPIFLTRVPDDHVGLRAGRPTGRLEPGFHLRVPFLQPVILIPTGPQRFEMTARLRTSGGVHLEMACEISGRLDPAAWSESGPVPRVEAFGAGVVDTLRRDLEAWGRFLPPLDLVLHGLDRDTLAMLTKQAGGAGLEETEVECGPGEILAQGGDLLPTVRRESDSVRTGVRVLMIGLDGADWRVLRPLLEAGAVPNLGRLLRHGLAGEIQSFEPMLSPLLWTTVVTGVSPDQHGVLDFLVPDPGTGDPVPIPATFRRAKAIWNLATEFSRSTSFVGWWATWPAETVAGTMVSDRVAYSLFETAGSDRKETAAIFPPSQARRLGRFRVSAESISFEEVSRFVDIPRARYREALQELGGPVGSSYRDPVAHLLKIIAATRTYHGMARELLAEGQPDLFGVYFQGIDEVSHRFAHFMPPKMEMVSKADFRQFGDTVTRFYVWQDQLLGELLDAVAADTMVVLLSDHGFLSGADRPEGLAPSIEAKPDRWHRSRGILILSGGPVAAGAVPVRRGDGLRFADSLRGVNLYDIAPTVLYASGLPISREMPGLPRLAALDRDFVMKTPLFAVDSFGPPEETGGPAAPRSSMDEEMMARLRSLGYLSGNAGAGGPAGEGGEPRMAATFHANRAFLRLEAGDTDGATVEVERALENGPEYLPALVLRARILEQSGDDRAALEAARTTLRVGIRQGDRQPGNLMQIARLHRRLGTAAGGLDEIARFGDVAVADPEFHLAIGLLRLALEDGPGAEASYREAVRLDPSGEEAVRMLFFLLVQQGRLTEAETLVRQAQVLAPDSVVHHNLIGLVQLESGELVAAEAAFEKARAIDPDDVPTLANLGGLYGRTGRLQEAVDILNRAVELEPENREALANLAAALGRLDRLDEVIFRLEGARARGVQSPEILNALGLAYMQSGRRAEAAATFRSSLSLRADQPPVENLLQSLEAGTRTGGAEGGDR